MGELAERGIEVAAGRASGLHGHARRVGPADRLRRAAAAPSDGASRESFIHIHVDRIDDESAARRDRRGARAGARRGARSACRTGGRCWRASARSPPSSRSIRRRCRRTRSTRRSQFLEWLVADNFTFLGVRDYAFTDKDDALRADARDRARPAALAGRAACCARGTPAGVRSRRRSRAFLDGAEAADRHQGERALARAPAHATWTTSASSASTPTASSSANSASSACSPRRPTRARPAPFRICAARSTPSISARRLRSRRPFRQGAGQRAGDLSARRAVPDRRGHALPVRDADPAARRAPARAGAGAARPLRPLRLGARLSCRATATTARCARAIGALSRRGLSRAASAPTIRSSRKGRWCACISSSAATAARRRDPDRAALEETVGAHRPHLDRRARRRAGAWCTSPAARATLFERYRDAFSDGYRDALFAAGRGRRHPASSKACRRSGRSASTSTARTETSTAASA